MELLEEPTHTRETVAKAARDRGSCADCHLPTAAANGFGIWLLPVP